MPPRTTNRGRHLPTTQLETIRFEKKYSGSNRSITENTDTTNSDCMCGVAVVVIVNSGRPCWQERCLSTNTTGTENDMQMALSKATILFVRASTQQGSIEQRNVFIGSGSRLCLLSLHCRK